MSQQLPPYPWPKCIGIHDNRSYSQRTTVRIASVFATRLYNRPNASAFSRLDAVDINERRSITRL